MVLLLLARVKVVYFDSIKVDQISLRWSTFLIGSFWLSPRDAQRADKKEIAGRRRKERPLMGKECVIFPEGGLSSYDIQPLY